MFVCDPYTIYDGDRKMAMSYYLASVIDYLNWVHGDRNIDYERVLRETKKLEKSRSHRLSAVQTLWEKASGDTDTVDDWTVDSGEISNELWRSLRILLEPGASALFHPAKEIRYGLAGDPPWSMVRFSMRLPLPKGIPADFDLYLNGDPRTRARHTYLPSSNGEFLLDPYDVADKHQAIQTLSITNVNRFPITVHLTRIEACRY